MRVSTLQEIPLQRTVESGVFIIMALSMPPAGARPAEPRADRCPHFTRKNQRL